MMNIFQHKLSSGFVALVGAWICCYFCDLHLLGGKRIGVLYRNNNRIFFAGDQL